LMPTVARDLADRFHEDWLSHNPFAATMYGIPGHDADVPDDSEVGEDEWRAVVADVLSDAESVDRTALSEPDRITLGCLIETADRELVGIDLAAAEHTVTSMPFAGPAVLFAVAARTVLGDAQAAADYVQRLRASGTWIDQLSERLRIGASKGRLPVAPLVVEAIEWAETVLAADVPAAITAPAPPAGWDGTDAWQQQRDDAAREVVRPALGRWVDQLREMLPDARPATQPGLAHLPGGEADYAAAIRLHTTLPLTPDELHQTGLDQLAELEARATRLGAAIGLADLDAVRDAIRNSA
jgi:uncharacterized protein (DUF885 family)